eukprot:TRINITY_DN2115_c0_g4_i2.p1 TRINITY_DN2115_c0_g4~~TRINITY_DN2115_c0_g4_i2.p1  ORF type:complete len:827 (-),score=359.80 TRINITY_DN2115_c0_g4_i2:165-2645(-)
MDYFLIYHPTGEKIKLYEGKTLVLGRSIGPLKEIKDERCSRRQAEISIDDDGNLSLRSCGVNSTSIAPSESESYHLKKNESVKLKDGDSFYMPSEQEFSVIIEGNGDQNKGKKKEIKDDEEYEEEKKEENKPKKVKKIAEEEEDYQEEEKEEKKEKKVVQKDEKLDKPKYVCKYGASCYSKDPKHKAKYSHPEPVKAKANADEPKKEVTKKPFNNPFYESPDSKGANAKKVVDDEEEEEEAPKSKKKVEKKLFNNPFLQSQEDDMEQEKKNKKKKKESEEAPSAKKQKVEKGEDSEGEEVEPDSDGEAEATQEGVEEKIDFQSAPKTLKDGETVDYNGHELSRKGDVYKCDCESWKYTPGEWKTHTCKHLIAYLGQKHENDRLGHSVKVGKESNNNNEAVAASNGGKKVKKVPALLLANKWTPKIDPKGWWMSEKLDGVRAFWDGKDFVSRLGNVFNAPEFFKEELPKDMQLDGELWLARRAFQSTVSVVRTGKGSDQWKKLQYKVFDSPNTPGTFEERQAVIAKWLKNNQCQYASLHDQEECEGNDHLKKMLSAVEKLGGEGLMLRQKKSVYVPSRSDTLLKVKSFEDAEAKVLKHEPGKGKYSGMCGSLYCDMGNGRQFSVGSGMSDKDRKNPPPVGSVITYRFMELTDSGIPRFPTFIGVRLDAKWPPAPDQIPKIKPKINLPNAYSNAEKKSKKKVEDDEEEEEKPKKKKENKKEEKPKKFKGQSKEVLADMTFSITGTHSVGRKQLIEIIQNAGGRFSSAVTQKGTDYLIATQQECACGTNKVEKARSYEVPIVSEQFLIDCIDQGRILKHAKYIVDETDD